MFDLCLTPTTIPPDPVSVPGTLECNELDLQMSFRDK